MVENGKGKDNKIYPFKSEEDREKVQGLFDAKLRRNLAAGETALSTGEYNPFAGFSREAMKNLFVLEMELDDESQRQISERVVKPMKEIAESLGISEIVFAGDADKDPHITLHVGRFDHITPEERENIKQWLAGKSGKDQKHMSHLRWASDILTGLKFDIDTVVLSGRDTYISAGKAEGNQGAAYRVRAIFDKALERAQEKFATNEDAKIGPHYPRYDDIFHITVARFTDQVGVDKLQSLEEQVYAKIGKDLAEQPISIRSENVNLIMASEGIEKGKSELLNE